MSEGEKHLRDAAESLRHAKPFLHGADNVQSLVESLMVVDILANIVADEHRTPKPAPHPRHEAKFA